MSLYNYHYSFGHRRFKHRTEVKQSLLIVPKEHFLFTGIEKHGLAYRRLLRAKKMF